MQYITKKEQRLCLQVFFNIRQSCMRSLYVHLIRTPFINNVRGSYARVIASYQQSPHAPNHHARPIQLIS